MLASEITYYECCQLSMKLRGSLLVIVCCLVVEICNIIQEEHLFFWRSIALPAIGGHGENFPYTSSIFSVYVVVEMYGRH